jgi:hypothetical protein
LEETRILGGAIKLDFCDAACEELKIKLSASSRARRIYVLDCSPRQYPHGPTNLGRDPRCRRLRYGDGTTLSKPSAGTVGSPVFVMANLAMGTARGSYSRSRTRRPSSIACCRLTPAQVAGSTAPCHRSPAA